jgi:hypothetical protein
MPGANVMHHDGAVRQEKGDAGAETGLVVERLPRLGNSNPGRGEQEPYQDSKCSYFHSDLAQLTTR